MKKKYNFKSICFLCLIILSIINMPYVSYAKDKKNIKEIAKSENEKKDNKVKWEIHKSITEVFDVKFPKKYKYKIFPFQFNNDTIAFALEITASLDNKDAKVKEKSALIKVTQTFGDELTYRNVKNILNSETEKYKQAAKSMNGKLVINEEMKHNGFLGKKFYITYKSRGKKFGLRVMVYMTNYSKIEQVLTGPIESMYSYRSDDFFDTIKLYDGRFKKENPIGVGWIDYTSKNNIFTAVLPPKNSDFTPFAPKFFAKPKREIMEFEILDPVINKKVKYNIYSYKNNKPLTLKHVKKILFSKHISKFIENASADNLKTNNTVLDGVTTMKTKLIISPTEKYPDVNSIFFEAKFKGDTLVIQELLTNNAHANSGLDRTLFSLMKFHPEKYKAVEMPAKKEKQPPASEAK